MAQLPRDFIQRVLDSTDIVSLIDSHVSLQKRGKDHWALCPFCDDGSKPSFSVNISSFIIVSNAERVEMQFRFSLITKGKPLWMPWNF